MTFVLIPKSADHGLGSNFSTVNPLRLNSYLVSIVIAAIKFPYNQLETAKESKSGYCRKI